MPEVFNIVRPDVLTSGPAAPSGTQVLNGTPGYLISDYVREVVAQRDKTLAETYAAFTRLLYGIQTVLNHVRGRVIWSQVAFDTITWTHQGHLVLRLTYATTAPSESRVPRIHDFVDDVVQPALGIANAPCKSLITGLCDQLAVAAKHHTIDPHRVRFEHVRSTRSAQIIADIRHGRRPFPPLEAAW